ncbi:uncharacterized protein B0I36DRAFT_338809 [Microdochium trichocladiopsis]|uniref:Uncharacterized protein n=1 Tax=Microdochium trichocladiopsis TaxID=1682393 RepID=A0A9P8XSL6_9PEZI|nr:uncharacterized protein B0I36DRAFT_338809 [Microdochium trichocladiopsis]KAH7014501.1 hypothetical protein B0I36DRAFT_338809 [Microdochium trichocladiopsis]
MTRRLPSPSTKGQRRCVSDSKTPSASLTDACVVPGCPRNVRASTPLFHMRRPAANCQVQPRQGDLSRMTADRTCFTPSSSPNKAPRRPAGGPKSLCGVFAMQAEQVSGRKSRAGCYESTAGEENVESVPFCGRGLHGDGKEGVSDCDSGRREKNSDGTPLLLRRLILSY